MSKHENEWDSNRMNNDLSNEDKYQHNVQYLVRKAIEETKRKFLLFVDWFCEELNLLCKPWHVDEKKDFVMSMSFDSMQMHEEEFSINQIEDFDDNHFV